MQAVDSRRAFRRTSREGRPARAGAATYEPATSSWRVSLPDTWLDLHSRQWSAPVQFRAERDGEAWRIRVRDANKAIERVADAVMRNREASRSELVLVIEAAMCKVERV
jgi:hypothetical protein